MHAKPKLIIATHNPGKVREFDVLMAPLGYEVISAGSLGLAEPEETGETFEANAELKAHAAAVAANIPALSDDSGLVVPVLDGAPGIYSARWAGPGKDFAVAMQRIADELRAKGVEPTGTPAYFVCALSYADANGATRTVRGEVHGTLTFPARGSRGFGYDPIFVAEGYSETFGEMDPDAKHRISHRAKALDGMLKLLQQERAT
jgi:XTP/dITP diphosphohydrolase